MKVDLEHASHEARRRSCIGNGPVARLSSIVNADGERGRYQIGPIDRSIAQRLGIQPSAIGKDCYY